MAALNQVGPSVIQTMIDQRLSLVYSARDNDQGEDALICIKNPVNENGFCHSMILPPYPIISDTQPQNIAKKNAHVRHLSPKTT